MPDTSAACIPPSCSHTRTCARARTHACTPHAHARTHYFALLFFASSKNELFQSIENGHQCNAGNASLVDYFEDGFGPADPAGAADRRSVVTLKKNCTESYHKPYFIVWYNHSYMALVLPPLLLYLAYFADFEDSSKRAGGGGGGGGVSDRYGGVDGGNVANHSRGRELSPLLSVNQRLLEDDYANDNHRGGSIPAHLPGSSPSEPKCPPAGFARVTWYLHVHGTTWRQCMWTGVWGGFLFMLPNWGWFAGLGMKGVLPSEASAAGNSSFAWVYALSLLLKHEQIDWVKSVSVLFCLGGIILLAISNDTGDNHNSSTTASRTRTRGDGSSSNTVVGWEGYQSHFHANAGILIEAAAAFTMALYYIAFQRWGLKQGAYPAGIVAIITGMEGLAHLLLFWVGFYILSITKVEVFAWPTVAQLKRLSVGATMAFTGNLALMEGLALLPNPLIVSVAALCITPLTFLLDLVLHNSEVESASPYKICGALVILCTFCVIILRDWWKLKTRKLAEEQEAV